MSSPEGNRRRISRSERRQMARQQAKQERSEQRTMSRRSFLSIVVPAAGLGTVAAGYGIWVYLTDQESKERELARVKDEETRSQKATEAIIFQTDRGFSALYERLKGKLEEYSPEDRQALLAPIALYDLNRANQSRNHSSILLNDLNNRGIAALETPTFQGLENLGYFFIQDKPQAMQFVGAFDPLSRNLMLSPQFRGDNFYDILIAYHETEHARQDAERRASFIASNQWGLYMNLHEPRNGLIVVKDEYQAYIKEVLVFNALTEGKLKKDILASTVDVEWYMDFLNTDSQQKKLVESEIEIARKVFTSGSDLHNFTAGFKNFVNNQYPRQTLVDILPGNRIVPVN